MSTTLDIYQYSIYDSGAKSYSDYSGVWTWQKGELTGLQTFGYGSDYGYKAGGGIRFRDVNIPPGSTINTAYITVVSRGNNSVGTVNAKIRGEDVDDATAYSTLTDFDGRTRTTAQVTWSSVAGWTVNNSYNTPEIKTIIQEIIDREGWEYGNTIGLFIDDFDDLSSHSDGAARQFYCCYPSLESYGPILHVEFTGDKPTVTTQAVSDIGVTTATGNGNITFDGDDTITERGVCYGTSPNPTTADTTVHDDTNAEGAFTMSLTGLTAGQRYYLRAYAINSFGTSYGEQVVFIPGWTDTKTWAHKDIVTHTELNSYVRDNGTYLKSRVDRVGTCAMANQTSNRVFSQADSTLLSFVGPATIYQNDSLKPRIIMACISATLPGSGESIKAIGLVTGESTPPTVVKTKQSSNWIILSTTMYSTIFGIVPPGWYYIVSYYDFQNSTGTPDTLSYWYEFDIG